MMARYVNIRLSQDDVINDQGSQILSKNPFIYVEIIIHTLYFIDKNVEIESPTQYAPA